MGAGQKKKRSSEDWLTSLYDEQLEWLIYNARFVSDFSFTFAVPGDASPELVRNMVAGVKTYYSGRKSIDRVLKEYGDKWPVEGAADEQASAFDTMLGAIRAEVDASIRAWTAIDDKPGELGRVAASGALLRLRTSFRSAALLIRMGHVYEVYAVCRMILEQTAWAYHVRDLPGTDVLTASPTKSITTLKRWLPETGRLYSFLSDHTHISFDVSRQFVRPGDDDVHVVLRSYDNALEAAWMLLRVADLYSVVTEHVYRDSLPAFRHVEFAGGRTIPRKDRPLLALLGEYREKIFQADSP